MVVHDARGRGSASPYRRAAESARTLPSTSASTTASRPAAITSPRSQPRPCPLGRWPRASEKMKPDGAARLARRIGRRPVDESQWHLVRQRRQIERLLLGEARPASIESDDVSRLNSCGRLEAPDSTTARILPKPDQSDPGKRAVDNSRLRLCASATKPVRNLILPKAAFYAEIRGLQYSLASNSRSDYSSKYQLRGGLFSAPQHRVTLFTTGGPKMFRKSLILAAALLAGTSLGAMAAGPSRR